MDERQHDSPSGACAPGGRSPTGRLGRFLPSIILSVLALVSLSPAGTLPAQELPAPALAPGPGLWADAVEAARVLVVEGMEEQGVPGLSVAVGVGGEIVWAQGFGFADMENRVPVWPSTKFRIASISKAVTAGAVGKLVEEGRLDLDAPVQEYVPEFPEKRWTVTTRQLAGHIAGVRHYRGEEFASRTHYDDVVDALEIFARDTLLFEPGTDYSYSTYGWNLVSAVVQRAAEEPFLDYMRREIFEPLGMDETVAEHVDSLIYHRSRAYLHAGEEEDRIVNAPYVDNSNKWAGGGFLSTAEDLVRYGSAHLGGSFLAPETVDLLWSSQETTDGEPTGYGIGWRVAQEDGRTVVSHTGGAMGGTTILLVYPEEEVVVAILTNVQGVGQNETSRAIADLFVGAPR